MTYDLALWQGAQPADGREALQTYQRVVEELDENYEDPPTPRISAFLSDLLRRWPEIDQSGGEMSPWSTAPLEDSASGTVCVLRMTVSPLLDEVLTHAADLARKHDLVCFDPQTETVLT